MEFLEGFEEDDDPQPQFQSKVITNGPGTATSIVNNTAKSNNDKASINNNGNAADTGHQHTAVSGAGGDGAASSIIGIDSNNNNSSLATVNGTGPTADEAEDDDVVLVTSGGGKGSSTSTAYSHPQSSMKSSKQSDYNGIERSAVEDASVTASAAAPVTATANAMTLVDDNQATLNNLMSTTTLPSISSFPTSTAPITAIHPSTSFEQFQEHSAFNSPQFYSHNPGYAFPSTAAQPQSTQAQPQSQSQIQPQHASSSFGSNWNVNGVNGVNGTASLGRIPVIGSTTMHNNYHTTAPYGTGGYSSKGPNGSFQFNGHMPMALPTTTMPYTPAHQKYPQSYNIPSSSTSGVHSFSPSIASTSALASTSTNGRPLQRNGNGNGQYGSNGSFSQYSSQSSGRSSKLNGEGSAVIDLTDADDNDESDFKGRDRKTADSNYISDGEDDVKISSEKMKVHVKEDTDDDFEIVGEKPSEATMPVCIGQLTGMALILYPIAELSPPRDKNLLPSAPNIPMTSASTPPPMDVHMHRHAPLQPSAPGVANETIKLSSAQTGEVFGVVEHRLANVLGPIMTKDNKRGLGIWIEARVLRSRERSPMMLPLIMLLYCHPHLIEPVARILEKSAVYLEHPTSYDPALHNGFIYKNPHGGAISASAAAQRKQQALSSFQSAYPGYTTGGLMGARPQVKTVEVQREQVESMFKSMQSGADLGEAEPDPMITTKLYPHQKQALAFLLDRERLRTVEDVLQKPSTVDVNGTMQENVDQLISLWRPRKNTYGRLVGWQHVVTEVEIGSDRPPPQCRGAILADDMGLGKTIVIISLVAGTLKEAIKFASFAPNKQRDAKESFDALAAHPLGKPVSLSEFRSPLYGSSSSMGSFASQYGGPGSRGGKKKKESKTLKKREDAEAARLDKLQIRGKGSLIVCPLSTVVNWESQIEEHVGLAANAALLKKRKGDKSGTSTPATGLSVYIYHGNNRTNDLAELASYDIVLTTFSTLGSEYSRQARKEEQDEEGSSSSDGGIEELDSEGQPIKSKGKKRKRKKIEGDAVSPLQQIEWFRIVLDEAHMIKEHTTIQARAACELMAERRVCLTGTPLQNTLNDLFSLMRFLRLEPFTDRTLWTNYIGAPAKAGDPLGISRLQLLMRHLALRRTKSSTDKEGKPILQIPPKKDELRYLTLDEQEKAFYSSHHRRYKHKFEAMEKNDTLMKNYCSILQELLRLRQICAHMALVRDSEDAAALKGEDGGDVVSSIKAHGLSRSRALRLLALMRDTGAAQCDECGFELASGGLDCNQDTCEEDTSKRPKRAAKGAKKNVSTTKSESDEAINPSCPTAVMTRCQHLFCLSCFQRAVAANYPDAVTAADRATCSICRDEISPVIDAVQVSSSEIDRTGAGDGDEDTTSAGDAKHIVEHSTKIRSLIQDLFPLSQNNPASANYAGDALDLETCDPDPQFRPLPREATKTVVFSQWTKLLDRCEDGLNECNIKFERLEGSMNRNERSRALATFKSDLSCEVLLVSLRAGGVGLNLTHASRAYLMEPSWNPSVENQAVDRVHRLGQTRPVKTVRLIIKDSIEANMLEIQKRKIELASMSLSQTLSKAQLAERRLEDLRTLFK